MEIIERMENYNAFIKRFPTATIPSYQRQLVKEHIDTMRSDILNYINVNKVQPAIGLILMCRYYDNNTNNGSNNNINNNHDINNSNNINNNRDKYVYDIIDGQHRKVVIEQLSGEGVDITFNVGIVNVRSRDEAKMQYLMFNKSMNHSEVLDITHGDSKDQLMKECEQWLLDAYPSVFVNRSTKRPYINIRYFMDAFVKSNYYQATDSLQQFQDNFYNYNDYLGTFDIGQLTLGKCKINETTIQKIQNHGIYYAFLCGEDYFCL
jgi:hypothetical protein